MSPEKILIIDGTRSSDNLSHILSLLTDILAQHDAIVQIISLRHLKIKHCIGCFSCWDKTPGKCIHNDQAASVITEFLASDTVIFFTPLLFGGYSSVLKNFIDRLLPLALPFFKEYQGETRHVPRYATCPRLVGIGTHPVPKKELSLCFGMAVGRNAANFYAPSYATEVIDHAASPEKLSFQLQDVLARNDELPECKGLAQSMRDISLGEKKSPTTNKALLLIGSHKKNKPSTSALLGNILMKRLRKYGWSTEVLFLNGALEEKQQRDRLCTAVDNAETIVISFPLYCDTVPFLTINAFEIIAEHLNTMQNGSTKNLCAIANNGYPEAHNNLPALSTCRLFALETRMNWAGALALGAGEILLSGTHPTSKFTGFKGVRRPPLFSIDRALKIAAQALAQGLPIPEKAIQLMSNPPLPLLPFKIWRWFLIRNVNKLWNNEARRIGLSKEEMLERPCVKKR